MLNLIPIAGWINGFWPGMLWQMYHATGDGAYRAAAEGVEKRLEAVLSDPETLEQEYMVYYQAMRKR